MTRSILLASALILAASTALAVIFSSGSASAQQTAPGWFATGEWQCGPYVRIIVSTDGGEGIDWFIIGAWFDNHYTLRRGQLFYNGIGCATVGDVWPPIKNPKLSRSSGGPDDPRFFGPCHPDDGLPLKKGEVHCE
jgi:hypothetical protein